MAVTVVEADTLITSKLMASNPGEQIYSGALPPGVTRGIVKRFYGAPTTLSEDGKALAETIIAEVVGVGIGVDVVDANIVVLADGIKTALANQYGTTAGGEVFGITEYLPVGPFPRQLEDGRLEWRLGYKYNVYARSSP